MVAVIVGDMDRDSAVDKLRVNALLNFLRDKHRDLTIVSAACERGIGRFVIDRCLNEAKEFCFIEVAIKIWKVDQKDKLGQYYIARNPTLVTLGEIFFIFSSGFKLGHVTDLVERVKVAKLPMMIIAKDGSKTRFNMKDTEEIFE